MYGAAWLHRARNYDVKKNEKRILYERERERKCTKMIRCIVFL